MTATPAQTANATPATRRSPDPPRHASAESLPTRGDVTTITVVDRGRWLLNVSRRTDWTSRLRGTFRR